MYSRLRRRLFAHILWCCSWPVSLAILWARPGIAERLPVQPAIGVVDRDAQALTNVVAFALVLDRFVSPLGRHGRRPENRGLSITATHPGGSLWCARASSSRTSPIAQQSPRTPEDGMGWPIHRRTHKGVRVEGNGHRAVVLMLTNYSVLAADFQISCRRCYVGPRRRNQRLAQVGTQPVQMIPDTCVRVSTGPAQYRDATGRAGKARIGSTCFPGPDWRQLQKLFV